LDDLEWEWQARKYRAGCGKSSETDISAEGLLMNFVLVQMLSSMSSVLPKRTKVRLKRSPENRLTSTLSLVTVEGSEIDEYG
jgi:hypothetical protein